MEAASPPLIPGALRTGGRGTCRAEDTGPLLRPQGCCASLRDGLRPAVTPETSAALQAGNTGRRQPAPPAARHVRV